LIVVTWPVPAEIDDATLERRMFDSPDAPAAERCAIDWVKVHEELKRRGVTLVPPPSGLKPIATLPSNSITNSVTVYGTYCGRWGGKAAV